MHHTSLFPFLSLLAAPVLGSTTYGCWSEQSNKFHVDCMVAASAVVMRQTGNDDQAWIPPSALSYSWGACTANIYGKDNGYAVPALNLIASFEQLGSRCQNGFFYYDSGYIDAELQGRAGWWRRKTRRSNKPKIAGSHDAATTWNTTEEIPHYISPKPDKFPFNVKPVKNGEGQEDKGKNSRLAKRQNGVFVQQVSNGFTTWSIYRGAQVVAGRHPSAYNLVGEGLNALSALIDGAIGNNGNELLTQGVDTTSGSTVNVLAFAVQLGGKYSSWQNLFNSFGDGRTLPRTLLSAALNDWDAAGFTGGIYHVYDSNLDVVFSILINGVVGSVDGFPSS
ncbi:hypothetical protein TWF694_004083 [Orbilia ellipsospora]|uniref:Uncharacterized protein n=1 Tax=Orbilia ellipsospora TaxID=2528407 RepID=A0AAV9WWU7_9PEZI